MIPPIFQTVSNFTAATNILGSSPCRFYPAGNAPQNVAKPYATYQVISGLPENYLNQTPDVDEIIIQISCYAERYDDLITLIYALRDAVETVAHIDGWGKSERESETMLYGFSFDVAWHVKR